MSPERKIILAVIGIAALVVLALLFYPSAKERFLPQPVAAWVAIEAQDSGVAVVGPVELDEGTPFRLHAVLEAEDRDGSRVFYTEAPGLRLPDGPVADSALRRWDRARTPKILWFSVEGGLPYLELETADQLERFHFEDLYRPSWPQAWAIPGQVKPSESINEDYLFGADRPSFGTQRYHVRLEVFSDDEALVPDQRFKSWGAARLPAEAASFPTVTVRLPGILGPASETFGLTQIEPVGPSSGEMRSGLRDLTEQRLAFTRLGVLGKLLETQGRTASDLRWESLLLDGSVSWGDGVAPGDLVQVLDRVVLLYRDANEDGQLDTGDLCFDFAKGAAVRPLDQVFDFSEGSEVSWVSLGSEAAGAP